MAEPLPTELERVTRAVTSACDDLGIEFAVIGGVAVGAFGLVRATDDVDLCLNLGRDESSRVEALLDALERRAFRFDRDKVLARLARGLNLFRVHLGRMRVDLMLRRPDGYWDGALRHRRRLRRGGLDLWVASPEDVIALKLVAARAVDLSDARNVLAVCLPEIDLDRLRRTVQHLSQQRGAPEAGEQLEGFIREAEALNEPDAAE